MLFRKRKKSELNAGDWQFMKAMQSENLPILTLCPQWHALFVNYKKSAEVIKLEERLTELLKQQGKYNTQNKEMKQKKKQLMSQIIYQMTSYGEDMDKKKAMQRDMIENINEHLLQNESELQLLPEQIDRVNEELLLETLKIVYWQVDKNRQRITNLDTQIDELRQQLSQKLLDKQCCEEYNHDVFNTLTEIVGVHTIELYDESHKSGK